jgi:hypothetical protein
VFPCFRGLQAMAKIFMYVLLSYFKTGSPSRLLLQLFQLIQGFHIQGM